MPLSPKRVCCDCRLFVGSSGQLCSDAKSLEQEACQNFRPGRPFAPKFHGRKTTDVKFDPEQPNSWAFWVSDRQVLMLAWELDHNQYGHFRCFLMNLNDNGVETKPFCRTAAAPAFAGEIAVKGPRENDVWRSFGYEDADEFDQEGNLTNKPREIKIYPARKD